MHFILYFNRWIAEWLPPLQAAKQVETWFSDDALHATGDLKAAASLAEGVTESASRLARTAAGNGDNACITAAHAQVMALGLATARQVSSPLNAAACFLLICRLSTHAVELG